jgi:hypothetical protein
VSAQSEHVVGDYSSVCNSFQRPSSYHVRERSAVPSDGLSGQIIANATITRHGVRASPMPARASLLCHLMAGLSLRRCARPAERRPGSPDRLLNDLKRVLPRRAKRRSSYAFDWWHTTARALRRVAGFSGWRPPSSV